MIGLFSDDCDAKKIAAWCGDVGNFTAASVYSSPHRKIAQKRVDLHTWLPAINMLESLAATFVTGVADEQTGLQAIGRTFCGTVENNYDLISFARSHGANSYYSNIVALYRTWSPRLTRAEIDEARRALDEQANRIETSTIPIIGAHDTTI